MEQRSRTLRLHSLSAGAFVDEDAFRSLPSSVTLNLPVKRTELDGVTDVIGGDATGNGLLYEPRRTLRARRR